MINTMSSFFSVDDLQVQRNMYIDAMNTPPHGLPPGKTIRKRFIFLRKSVMSNRHRYIAALSIAAWLLAAGCTADVAAPQFPVKNIVVVVIDGPRYTETWGDPIQQYIPYQSGILKSRGVFFTHFLNDSITYTTAGHDQLVTGVKEFIENTGTQLPGFPSFFQYWRKQTGAAKTDAWIITSKDKLQVLADCNDDSFHQQYNPSADCGISGLASGYRHDTVTLSHALQVLQQYHPRLLLIQFKEPDNSAHKNDWAGYINGIQQTDGYIKIIDEFLQNDAFYSGSTDLIITNDHGRHSEGWKDGFVSHGDSCDGCRHISLLAAGPHFNTHQVVTDPFNLCDLNATINYLLSVNNPYSEGKVMHVALRK